MALAASVLMLGSTFALQDEEDETRLLLFEAALVLSAFSFPILTSLLLASARGDVVLLSQLQVAGAMGRTIGPLLASGVMEVGVAEAGGAWDVRPFLVSCSVGIALQAVASAPPHFCASRTHTGA